MTRLALPLLAAAGSAYAAECSTKGTATIQNAADATALASCKTFTGDIAIETGAGTAVQLNGIKKLDGDLVVKNNTVLQVLSADSLEEITKEFHLEVVRDLNTLDFPKLKTVNTFNWLTLPNLLSMGFSEKVTKSDFVRIEDTQLQSLDGINLDTVGDISVQNNRFIDKIEMQLANVTGRLVITANNPSVSVKLDNLETANNMTFTNCSEVSVSSLTELGDSLSLIGNTLTDFYAPNLTKIGGALAINSNFELNNLTFPQLTTINRNLEIQNNTKLSKLTGFPKLKTINADLNIYGNMTEIDLPSIELVKGTFRIKSTGDIDNTCEEKFDTLKDEDKIRAGYECEGLLVDPGSEDDTKTGTPSDSKKPGAASSVSVQAGALLAGLAAVFLL